MIVGQLLVDLLAGDGIIPVVDFVLLRGKARTRRRYVPVHLLPAVKYVQYIQTRPRLSQPAIDDTYTYAYTPIVNECGRTLLPRLRTPVVQVPRVHRVPSHEYHEYRKYPEVDNARQPRRKDQEASYQPSPER